MDFFAVLRRAMRAPADRERPVVFVISYPRSGNTMLIRTLAPLIDAHILSGMRGAPDFFNIDNYPRSYPNIRLVKDHVALAQYVDRRAIILIRDGRDVMISLAYLTLKRGFHSFSEKTDFPDFIRWLGKGYRFGDWASHMRQVRTLLAGPDKCLVRYEDLMSSNGANVFGDVARFSAPGTTIADAEIAAAYQNRDAVLDFVKAHPDGEVWGVGASFEPGSLFHEWSMNRTGSNWRQSWTQDAKAAFHDTGATDFLIEHGYETDPDWWRQ